ncbi:MAG: hypothetical protein ACOZAL_03670 [Patescibacteria group bacterium]
MSEASPPEGRASKSGGGCGEEKGFKGKRNRLFGFFRKSDSGGAYWTMSELSLSKIQIANFDCRASRGKNKNFFARAGRGGKGEQRKEYAPTSFREFTFEARHLVM